MVRAISTGSVVLIVVVAAGAPAIDRLAAGHRAKLRVAQAEDQPVPTSPACSLPLTTTAGLASAGSELAAWGSFGGCGAGASAGGGVGLKWIGRNVGGGLFHVECQSSYTKLPDGYIYGVSTQVSRDLSDKWRLGVAVPWQYKYWVNPTTFGFDLSNEGLGDVSALLTRRLGPINATTITLSAGLPTGGYKAFHMAGDPLRQDKQLGHGKPTGGLVLDHTIDSDWGLSVFGGSFDYRGGENDLKSYRAPSASVYGYVAYLLGPLAPSLGLTVSKFFGVDKNLGRDQESALQTISPTFSIEWATSYFALLTGVSVPYALKGDDSKALRIAWDKERTMVSVGLALSPF